MSIRAALRLVLAAGTMMLFGGAHAHEVRIPGPKGDLVGEAIAVAGADHAVVVIPGSGPTDRNGDSALFGVSAGALKLLAEGLADRGVASIRIDKRGMFASEHAIAPGDDVTVAGYADDARAWVGAARDLAPCVWIAGHSEGGLVALVAGQAPPEGLCGLVLLATPGMPIGRLMVEQLRANPHAAEMLEEAESIVAKYEAGRLVEPGAVSQGLQWMASSPGLQRYMIDLFAYDPAALAAGWPGAALILQGDSDIQVGGHHAALLANAMPQAKTRMLAGATHMLKQSVDGDPLATYRDPTLPLHPDLVAAIVDFVQSAPAR